MCVTHATSAAPAVVLCCAVGVGGEREKSHLGDVLFLLFFHPPSSLFCWWVVLIAISH